MSVVDKATHPLQSSWSFWFDDKRPKKEPIAQTSNFSDYQNSLVNLGSFDTLESFWSHFSYLTKPEAFPQDCSLYLSRDGKTPAWETYPDGGCWILRVRKHNMIIDRLWEELCFACIGELFEHPDVVCVALNTRAKEDVLALWTSSTEAQFVIGKRLKELCNLDESTQVDYKTFRSAMKDGSSFKNAKAYVYNHTIPSFSQPSSSTYNRTSSKDSKPKQGGSQYKKSGANASVGNSSRDTKGKRVSVTKK